MREDTLIADVFAGAVTEERSGRELRTLLGAVGVCALDEAGWIEVRGADRVRWLNGMVTNSIGTLGPSEGCYNFFLSAQGRIQGDAYAFAEPERILLRTDRGQVGRLMEMLDRFIIMDDVELRDVSEQRHGVMAAGPGVVAMLGEMGIAVVAGVGWECRADVRMWGAMQVSVVQVGSPLVPRFEVWTEDEAGAEELRARLGAAGAVLCGPESLEWMRLMEGRPRYGVDIRDRELPQETGQTRALHFSKGCYLGQEIVERIRSRGAVHRGFGGFRLEGGAVGAERGLLADGKAVGELTSVADIPELPGVGAGMRVGLGYVRREALEAGQAMEYAGGVAWPMALPVRMGAESRGGDEAS